jgi:tellurium resistance protein TerD
MSVSLSKGQTVSLKKNDGGSLTHVRMGLGWDAVKKKGLFGGTKSQSIDLDASAVLYDGSGAVADQVQRIVFAVSIYEGAARGQSFGQVSNAFIRVVDRANGSELARYDLTEDASTETAMIFGELYRHNGEWKFRAVGQGYASGLAGIAKDYGVNVG